MTGEGVTLVVTSCGRPDLLERTLESFREFNTYPLDETIIIEDGESRLPRNADGLRLTYLSNGTRQGQIYSIDRAYSYVTTPYIFHCEDDWEFYRSGFIEESLEILRKYPTIFQVHLREHGDTNGHPITRMPQYDCEVLEPGYLGLYHGFSFNPGLRRWADFQKLAPFRRLTSSVVGKDWHGEEIIGKRVLEMGYHAAITPQGYVRHIGWERSVT